MFEYICEFISRYLYIDKMHIYIEIPQIFYSLRHKSGSWAMNNFYLINVYLVTIMLNTVLVSEDIGGRYDF